MQAWYCPTANFEPLSRGNVTNPILISVWYLLDPKVTGSLRLSQDPANSECSSLTHFSVRLARIYVSLKEPYNQDIKE